ncbi:DUF4878 domain-containing protein [Metaclostridioides mangenotii]|uniref:DUF4878 domain-containing protein n=1 Tax=Metaclostridioides mangenotii TaxID=1540 RepID=UPI00048001F4|nr:DUF4878 domain-containing protein [Clostridioides mangenotii]
MKKNLKLVALLTVFLSIALVFVGCARQTPSKATEEFFNQISENDFYEDMEDFMNFDDEEMTPEQEAEFQEVMVDALKKIKVEVLSEKVDGGTATVKVKLAGVDFADLTVKIFKESLTGYLNGNDVESDINKPFIEKIKNAKVTEREGTIKLNREDRQWIVDVEDKDFEKLVIGDLDKFEELMNSFE